MLASTSPTLATRSWKFGRCVLDVMARELSRDGAVQSFEPKVFDALVFLIERQQQVVSKEELLRGVWGRVVVTDGVVARTIMKARRLIGDDASQPTMIRTVHRIGYRFCAEAVPISAKRNEAPTQSSAAPRGTPVIAVLPIENATGNPALDWIDLGLMAVVIESIGQDDTFRLMSAADATARADTLRAAWDPEAGEDSPPDSNTECLMVTATQDAMSRIVLRYTGRGELLSRCSGEVAGADVVALARVVGAEVRRSLLVRAEPAARPAAGADADYATMLRERALAASARESWSSARKMWQVLVDLLPSDHDAWLNLLECGVRTHDPSAEAAMEEWATQEQDGPKKRRALHLIAVCRLARGDVEGAQTRLEAVLEEAQRAGDAAAEVRALESLAMCAAEADATASGNWLLSRAATLARQSDQPEMLPRILDTRGRLAAARGLVADAEAAFAEAVAAARAQGLHTALAYATFHLGEAHLGQGRFADACTHVASALDAAFASGDFRAIALAGLGAVRMRGIGRGDPNYVHSTLARLRATKLAGADEPRRLADLIDALLAARSRRLADAMAALERAEAGDTRRSLWYMFGSHRIRILACAGFVSEAEDTLGEFGPVRTGRLAAIINGVGHHLEAIILRMTGEDGRALDTLRSCFPKFPDGYQRLDALLDAAWIEMESGETHLANALGARLERATADGSPAALLVAARAAALAGRWQDAMSLQESYDALATCCHGTPASDLLTAYRHRELPGRVDGLPSLFDIAPSMELSRP